MGEPVTVRPATEGDLAYIDALCHREFEAVSFIPKPRYESAVGIRHGDGRPNSRLWVAEVNRDTVGFLYLTPGVVGSSAKVIQLAVQEDARRREYARALVVEAERHALAIQRPAVALSVAADLDASDFWQVLGYELRGVDHGGVTRGRLIERRVKALDGVLF